MAISKITLNGVTQMDVTQKTVTSGSMLNGTTALKSDGTDITGSIAYKTSSDLTVSDATVTAPAGYYANAATKSVAAGSATTPATTITANPSISVSSGGLITATASATKSITPTVGAGYVSSGTAGTVTVSGSNTSQLSTQAAQTIHPSTEEQSVTAGVYLTGDQTIAPVTTTNLIANNILRGVTVEVGDESDPDRVASVQGVLDVDVVVDPTLSNAGEAADAKVTGDKFAHSSQTSEMSDDLRVTNLFPATRKTATGNVSITPVEYSGIQLSGTIPYRSNVVLTNWSLNLSAGTYTMFAESKNNIVYPDDFNFDIFNASGSQYPVNSKYPNTFTLSGAVSNSAVRFYLNNSSYSSGLAVDDTIYIYICPGQHTLEEFSKIRATNLHFLYRYIYKMDYELFERGSLSGTGRDSTYNEGARIRTPLICADTDITITGINSNAQFVVYMFNANGTMISNAGWQTSGTIKKGTIFRLLLSSNPSASATVATDLIYSCFTFAYSGGLPLPPTSNGTYTLRCVVSDGVPTYSWVSA